MRRPTWRIGTRLLVAQTLVLVAAIATAAVIAAVVGPPLFREHMLRADRSPDPSESRHIEEAFRAASAISLGLAMAAALVVALAVSWYLTRRFQRPLTDLTRAATEVASGKYDARAAVGDAGPEIDSLATAFNTMASRLAQTEDTRRRLLSDLAHELRTPVATLSAYLEALEDGVSQWNDLSRTVLVDQVERLSRLAQDIDAVSRAEEGRLSIKASAVDVAELVDIAVRGQADSYKLEGVRLSVAADDRLSIQVDSARILQILTNLLDNALRHTPHGGQVSITWKHDNNEVTISVSDSGEGIAPAQLPHVFERFYRGDTARDRERQGSGIGLTISRAIAEAHSGHLSAYSMGPGTGSTFTLTIPRDAGFVR